MNDQFKGVIPDDKRYDNWRELPVAVFDFETTNPKVGDDSCRIVEVCVMLFDNSFDMRYQDDLTLLVNPGIPIEPGASKVHGVFDEDVQGVARLDQEYKQEGVTVVEKVVRFMAKADLICAHNGLGFDIPVLLNECVRVADMVGKTGPLDRPPIPTMPCIDTLVWERHRRQSFSKNKLSNVAKRYAVSAMQKVLSGEGALHEAKTDVTVLAGILKEMNEKLPYTFSQLIEEQWEYYLTQQEYLTKKYGK